MKILRIQKINKLVLSLFLLIGINACSGSGNGNGNGEADGGNGNGEAYTVTASATDNGSISPASASVNTGTTASFVVTPDAGYTFGSVSGCDGSLEGTTYITAVVNADCSVSASFIPAVSTPTLSFTQVKSFRFSWSEAFGATHYRLLENPDGSSGFSQVGGDIAASTLEFNYVVPLYLRVNAQYILQSCFDSICNDSSVISVTGNLEGSVGYFKASNTGTDDHFGQAVSLSGDGSTLAIGAAQENSAATGIDGDQGDDSADNAGAVYVFTRNRASWVQQAYIKASNAEAGDQFGISVSLSDDGNLLAVGANGEDSDSTGVNNSQGNGGVRASSSGAVYMFTRSADSWSQQAYLKASNTNRTNLFGIAVNLSGDGTTLAVGASGEDSVDTGVNGNQLIRGSGNQGAVYVFTRSTDSWTQQAYFKASTNIAANGNQKNFGHALSLSFEGDTLAVGARFEDSDSNGINGNENDNSANAAGAVYVFLRIGNSWSQQAYVKASQSSENDTFGRSVSLSDDGNTMAVGASLKSEGSAGINGSENSFSRQNGAVYVFTRDGVSWSQQAFIKPGNLAAVRFLGDSVSLSGNGNVLAAGATGDDSAATGIDGEQVDADITFAGAVFLFTRNGGAWSEQSYIKASNTNTDDSNREFFGRSVSLSNDGATLAVGADEEDSRAVGIGGDQSDTSVNGAGAVYIY